MKFSDRILKQASLSVIATLFFLQAQAQSNPLFLHLHDKMVETNKYSEVVDGSAYFNENWLDAAVMLNNNVLIENVKLRIDLLANEIHYLDSAGKEMISTQPIKSIIFKNSANDTSAVFVSGLVFPENKLIDAKSFMQLLSKGKASLVKQYEKKITEQKGYASATVEKKISTEVKYFVWHNNSFTRVKNIQEIADALQDPKLAAGKKNSKSEADLKATVDAFNKL
ncbi:MAG TPA: hypothetical protein VLC98_13785 [Phnomibacter sp.]|nr:hypothetical protein [Phnomibacter sp.]